MGVTRWTGRELASMPTLATSQSSDLKVDEDGVRFWLARTNVEDGEPYEQTVHVEQLIDGRWEPLETYDGDPMAWAYSWTSTVSLRTHGKT